jgi:heme/copper-type cytochrome/quinol oxidase subunit 2
VQKLTLLIVLGTFALAAVVLYSAALKPFVPSDQATTISGLNCSSYYTTFTIYATQEGYNNSIGHLSTSSGNLSPSKHWPVLCAHTGEEITITVVNQDIVEPHGFAVAGYMDAGVTVLPGKTDTISFYASTPGDFKIYCNVICAVHPFMQSGVLVLTN